MSLLWGGFDPTDALRVFVEPLTVVEPNEPGGLNTHTNHR